MKEIRFRGKRIDTGELLENTQLTLINMITDNKGLFLCSCGKETVQYLSNIENGRVKSCGCQRYKNLSLRNQKHNMHGTRLYNIWRGLFKRCENPNSTDYFNYGGRGITICEEWHDFNPFYLWSIQNEYNDNLTIDRLNENGNYEPLNCRWATTKQQSEHKRKRIMFCERNNKGQFIKKGVS